MLSNVLCDVFTEMPFLLWLEIGTDLGTVVCSLWVTHVNHVKVSTKKKPAMVVY